MLATQKQKHEQLWRIISVIELVLLVLSLCMFAITLVTICSYYASLAIQIKDLDPGKERIVFETKAVRFKYFTSLPISIKILSLDAEILIKKVGNT